MSSLGERLRPPPGMPVSPFVAETSLSKHTFKRIESMESMLYGEVETSGAAFLPNNSPYKAGAVLGTGAFGIVIRAVHRETKTNVAIKLTRRNASTATLQMVRRELLTHCKLMHPHIARYVDVFLTAEYIAHVMEYVPGGDLAEKPISPTEDQIRTITQQIVVAVDYAHLKGVAFRDLKQENTLVSGNGRSVKLVDFGHANDFIGDTAGTRGKGTLQYMAPELIQSQGASRYDAKLIDVWSIGVLVYVMLFRAYPFKHSCDSSCWRNPDKLMAKRICKGKYRIPSNWSSVSAECRDFIRRCLRVDPTRRITVEGIFQHSWFIQALPQGVREMNRTCLDLSSTMQERISEMQSHIHNLLDPLIF